MFDALSALYEATYVGLLEVEMVGSGNNSSLDLSSYMSATQT